jgi:hypothetical protein
MLIYAPIPLRSLCIWMSAMMFAFHSCRETFSSYFHSSGNEEEMKTDISLINLQSYFLFCMLNKYELCYFEIRCRSQPCSSYWRLFILKIVIRSLWLYKNSRVLFSELYFLHPSVSFGLDADNTHIYNEQNRHHSGAKFKNEWSCTSTLAVPLWLLQGNFTFYTVFMNIQALCVIVAGNVTQA